MTWEGAELLAARLERWRPAGWVEHEGGGLTVCHTPGVAPQAWLHRFYPGLSEERLAQTEAAYDRPLPAEYRRFLGWANGADLFAHLGLNGSHVRGAQGDLLDRSGVGIGQPVSLDYGNQIGWPAGASPTAWVIGTISGWSGQGYLLLNQSGEVRLCALTDASNVAVTWPSLSDMVFSEFDRMAAITGDHGEPLAPDDHFLPEPARRWEAPRVERRGLRDLFWKRK